MHAGLVETPSHRANINKEQMLTAVKYTFLALEIYSDVGNLLILIVNHPRKS